MPKGVSEAARNFPSEAACLNDPWRFSSSRFVFVGLPGLLLVSVLFGCDPTSEIVVERVPKDATPPAPPTAPAQPAAKTERMLASIMLNGNEAVFFKVSGVPEAVAAIREPFLKFVGSFRKGEPPTWTVPEGWNEEKGNGERLATVTIPAEPPMELTVTSLPFRGGSEDAYRLANVNRWRGQLGLAPITEDALHAEAADDVETFQVPMEGAEVATVVDITGQSSGGMGGPFQSMMGAGGGMGMENPAMPSGGGDAGNDGGLSYTTPEGWQPAAGNAFSRTALSVDDATITVTDLAAGANSVVDNFNRWRGQVQLEPLEESALKEQLTTITLGDGQPGEYAVLTGSAGQSMLGVIVTRGDTMWFVKMMGSDATIAREKPRFEEFVKSLQFKENSR